MDDTTLERPADPTGETAGREYVLIADKTKELVAPASTDYNELKKLANAIRRAGGEVTMFKSMDA